LKRVLSKKLNDTSYEWLNEQEKKYRQLARDYRTAIWDQARLNITKAKEFTETVANRLQTLTDTITQIQEVKAQLGDELDKSKDNIDNLKSLLLNIHDDYQVNKLHIFIPM
jgi:phage shock protein A